MHLELLKQVKNNNELPAQANSAIQEKINELVKVLLDKGDWVSDQQIPKFFTPKLRSLAWHNINDYPELLPAYNYLLASHTALVNEYKFLKENSLLEEEAECIHDKKRGQWMIHDITAFWILKDSSGCSISTPVACRIFSELKDLGLPVIRAGYSVIAPGAWLRPHFGMTNAQLKFHLGLIVPEVPMKPCTVMRVSNQIREWNEGKISFFDDSFEHEVWNNCTSERVVFQVVFQHPDLKQQQQQNIINQNNNMQFLGH